MYANGTLMALVELGKVPADGTWEVLFGAPRGWVSLTNPGQYFAPEAMKGMLVVARPVGSNER